MIKKCFFKEEKKIKYVSNENNMSLSDDTFQWMV